jgi:hypothetical protein
MGGWDYVIMVINLVLFWGLIILGVIGVFRYLAGGDRPTRSRNTGEHSDEQEYHQWLHALRRRFRPHAGSSHGGRRSARAGLRG